MQWCLSHPDINNKKNRTPKQQQKKTHKKQTPTKEMKKEIGIKSCWPLFVANQDLKTLELYLPLPDLQNNWIVLFTSKISLVPVIRELSQKKKKKS